MKPTKGLSIHLGLFGVATLVAFTAATHKTEPVEGKRVEAELWGGKPDAIESITLTSDERIVKVTPHKDAEGRYAVVDITKTTSNAKSEDGDTDSSNVSSAKGPKQFIAVDALEALLPALAPAKSYRSLGVLPQTRLVEYGLDKPESTLQVRISGQTHQLDIGAFTPGSSDYYVRNPATGVVTTFAAESITRLKYGESRLIERDLHGFKVDDVENVVVSAGGKSRKLQRIVGKPAWADLATPTVQDETAGNWLLKVQRLKPVNFVEKPANLGTVFVRVDYNDAKRSLGYLELYRSTGTEQKYFARTERTRWVVELPKSLVEPIDQDLGSVVK
jgi:hypothetical protein